MSTKSDQAQTDVSNGNGSALAREAGDSCAPGCIYSAFCVNKNATAKRYTSRTGGELVCVTSGDCSRECAVR